jgi:hypothetical protein
MSIAQTSQEIFQRLSIHPLNQLSIVLKIGDQAYGGGDGFVTSPLTGFPDRRSHSHLPTIDGQFLNRGIHRWRGKGLAVYQTLLSFGRNAHPRQIGNISLCLLIRYIRTKSADNSSPDADSIDDRGQLPVFGLAEW